MADSLTYEKVLELIAEASRRSNEDLDRRMEKSRKKFDDDLEKSRKEFDERMKKLDGKFGNVLGAFVEGLVEPKLIELFQNRGILVTEIHHNIQIHGKGQT